MDDQSISEILIKANDACIRYPRFSQLCDDIRDCQEMSKIAREPQCMVLDGLSGTGKTTLVQEYAKEYVPYDAPGGTKIPVLYVPTPSPVTVKGMAETMLRALGDPAAARGSTCSMDFRLVHYLKACEVELVILDDFQHLIDAETNRVLTQVSEWLKTVIKASGIPFLLVGIEGKIDLILDTNRQLSRLFAVRETLAPFSWDPADPESSKHFASLVFVAEQAIGKSIKCELPREEIVYRVYCSTGGIIANLMNLLRYAALLAERKDLEVLTLPILKQAYAKRLKKHMNGTLNPFDAAIGQRLLPPEKQSANNLEATGRPSNREKKPDPPVGQVLTTR